MLSTFDRLQDLDTIRFLQDKHPQLSFMFVCNKVDTTAIVWMSEAQSSDELDSDEEETERPADYKQRIVFAQLQQHGLIAKSESYDSCSSFYGISAKDARKERLQKTSLRATELFSKFKADLVDFLEKTIKRQAKHCKQVVDKLICLQASLNHAMERTRKGKGKYHW